MQHYSDPHWQPLMIVALFGAVLILFGIGLTIVQVAVSIRQRRAHRDRTGDPWNARTLEWSIPSPPPAWNFARVPVVESIDAFWRMKEEGDERREMQEAFVDLHVPRNTPVGFFLAFFAVILGFALIWRIEWLSAAGLVGAAAVVLAQAWRTDREVRVSAEEIAAFERAHGAATFARAQVAAEVRS